MIFSFYNSINDIIIFLKDLKYEIEEKNDNLIIKFNVYMPNGAPKLIELNLQKILTSKNDLVNYLLEEIKSMKNNIKNIEMSTKTEIESLKNSNIKLQKEISDLKEQNKKLLEKNNKLILFIENLNKIYLDSKIIESINSINFIIEYIKENNKLFNFKEIKLLYRGSRDGDRTKTCHELCDNKKNVLIIIQSDTGYMFGGYSKIGFKTNNIRDEWKIDNNCFLFSVNLKKIYPVIRDKEAICHIKETFGLCFFNGLGFYDNFMNETTNKIHTLIKEYYNDVNEDFEMNGGNQFFKCKELEVFQLL